jgi:hypothetical protein
LHALLYILHALSSTIWLGSKLQWWTSDDWLLISLQKPPPEFQRVSLDQFDLFSNPGKPVLSKRFCHLINAIVAMNQ